MQRVPFDRATIGRLIDDMGIDVARASIREMNALVDRIESLFDTSFIRMEFGIPGFRASDIAVAAEHAWLSEQKMANVYAPFDGIPVLKEAGSRFAEAFLGLEIPPHCVVPTNGAMHACFISLAIAGGLTEGRDRILFLDPGFPVNKLQTRFLGLESVNLDLKDYRGEALAARVDELCREQPIGGCLWSSPNNPAWVILSDDELRALAAVLERHGVVAVEDFAYFGMDFRTDYSVPFAEPYQPTIARYTDRVFSIVSSSKLLSYAGQRCAITLIPPAFAASEHEGLLRRFAKRQVLAAFLQGGIYPTTASIAQGPQRGLAALLEAMVEGRYNPWEEVREYAERAAFMKRAFIDNGFHLVYDSDLGEPLADGFYFTIAYPGMSGAELLREIVHYGISAITLEVTGSRCTEGLRACTSLTSREQFPELEHRLRRFREDHPI